MTGMYPRMGNADTPLVHEETRTSPHRRPASNEAFYECPSCLDTFPKSYMEQQCFFEAGVTRKLKDVWPPIPKPCFTEKADVSLRLASVVNHTGNPNAPCKHDFDDVSD